MRGMLVAVAAILISSLAGCANAPTEGPSAVQQQALQVDAPEWVVGQHWSYRTQNDGTAGAVSLVVTGDDGGDWIVDTNDANMAYYDDLGDVSYLGQVRKSDLAGSQGNDRVQFFDFPLTHNKTWTTTWDGETTTLQVKDIQDNGDVHIMGHQGARMHSEYVYSPVAGFFESITFFDGNGTAVYSMERTDHGTEYGGSVLRYDVLEPYVLYAGPLSVQQSTVSFGDATEIRLLIHAFCNGDTVGSILVGAAPKPDDEVVHLPPLPMVMEPPYGIGHDCDSGQVAVVDEGVIQLEPGQYWNFDMLAGSQNGEALVIAEPRILTTLSGPF